MSYFIATGNLRVGTEARLEGAEAKHALLSRRMRTGEQIEVQDQDKKRFLCQVKTVGKTELIFTVLEQVAVPKEYKTEIILCQGLISEQALDFVIQKATELGAHQVCVFQAEHSPKSLRADKQARWNRIAAEAAKQCGRIASAHIGSANLERLLLEANKNSAYYFAQDAAVSAKQEQIAAKSKPKLLLFIGPEGGWSTKETELFATHHIPALRLSPFTLRAETAAITAISQFAPFLD